jgi:hypothetical protein
MAALVNLGSSTAALVIHAIAAPLFFTVIAWHYFRGRGAREAASTAIVWTATVALFDLIFIAGAARHSIEMFKSLAGTWLPFGLIFIAARITGVVMSMLPDAKDTEGGA